MIDFPATAQKPPVAELEAAARVLNTAGWTCHSGYHEPEQFDECSECRRVCTDIARAALVAASQAR